MRASRNARLRELSKSLKSIRFDSVKCVICDFAAWGWLQLAVDSVQVELFSTFYGDEPHGRALRGFRAVRFPLYSGVASWLNAVESFFAKLTKKRLRRGVFRSLKELRDAIHRFLDDTNADPKPFTWTKDPNKIIAAVKRGYQVLDSIH
jgi:hypothetical protein